MTNNNAQKTSLFISRSAHKALFEGLVDSMRAYASAINSANDGDVYRADMAMQAAAVEFLRPYGYTVGHAFMAMVRADVNFKKNADGVRVFGVPSGATVRTYIRTEVFPRIGLVWQSCVKVGEKQVKAKKDNKVDFGSISIADVVNGMSPARLAEFRAAIAALDAAAANIAAD